MTAAPPAPASEWCDVHGGYVDEGRTRPIEGSAATRICDGCATERGDLAAIRIDVPALASALAAAISPTAPIEDKAAAYAALYTLQLRLNRVLRNAPRPGEPSLREVLTGYLEAQGEHARLGPLYLKAEDKDVAWPCNEAGNWTDAGVQEAMRDLKADSLTSPYIRHVPEHLEVDTVSLGSDVHAGIAAARALWLECRKRKWRTAEGKTSPRLRVARA